MLPFFMKTFKVFSSDGINNKYFQFVMLVDVTKDLMGLLDAASELFNVGIFYTFDSVSAVGVDDALVAFQCVAASGLKVTSTTYYCTSNGHWGIGKDLSRLYSLLDDDPKPAYAKVRKRRPMGEVLPIYPGSEVFIIKLDDCEFEVHSMILESDCYFKRINRRVPVTDLIPAEWDMRYCNFKLELV